MLNISWYTSFKSGGNKKNIQLYLEAKTFRLLRVDGRGWAWLIFTFLKFLDQNL